MRSYPGHDIAANLVGFMGTDKPYGGLEEVFNRALSGKDGSEKYEVGAGNRIPLGDNTTVPAIDGQDLHTTIDRDLQWYTQRVLRQAREDSGGQLGDRGGHGLPHRRGARAGRRPDVRRRRPGGLAGQRPPGPVAQPLLRARLGGEGAHAVRADRHGQGQRPHQAAGPRRAAPPGPRDPRPLGARADQAHPGRRAGQVVQRRHRAGLRPVRARASCAPTSPSSASGQPTNVGLGAESRGNLPDPSIWTDQIEDRIAFGQSLSVNAMQMAAAVNTIANHGVRVDPTLIQGQAKRDDGMEIGTDVSTSSRVVSAKAARQMTLMMERVVDPEDGVAPRRQVPGYRVAGKTGTAQRVGTCMVNGVRSRAATTAPTPSPSPASPRPRTRGSPSTS